MSIAEHNEELVQQFFAVLSTGELENIRATLHPEASWTPMVKDVPGAGVHTPRDVIVDEFLAPVRGMCEADDLIYAIREYMDSQYTNSVV